MTVQSSFLVRCLLNTAGTPIAGKAYSVQHVQTGAEFRSAVLAEISEWIAAQNLKYLADQMKAAELDGPEEDLR